MVRKLGFSNWIRLEATGYSSGIWVLWNEHDVAVDYELSSTQFVHVKVKSHTSNHTFWLTCIYVEPIASLRKPLWDNIRAFNNQDQGPWLVARDFNSYRSIHDKTGGTILTSLP